MRRKCNVDKLIHLNMRGKVTRAIGAAADHSMSYAVAAILEMHIASHSVAAIDDAVYFSITRAVGMRVMGNNNGGSV